MKLSPYLSTSLAAGAFLLASSFALAQTTSAARNMHPRDAASGQSSGRQARSGSAPGTAAQGMAVDHAGGNGVRRAAGDKTTGVNPLYESKDKANLKPNAGASNVQPYKDGEDMTTRYRPGNNKTTRTANDAAAPGAGAAQPQAMPKKHIAGVKYEDRMAGDNPGGTAGQSAQGNAQRKDGSIIHSDFPRSTDRNSAHATESLSPSNGGGNGARGMAVNEQGSRGPAQIYKRH